MKFRIELVIAFLLSTATLHAEKISLVGATVMWYAQGEFARARSGLLRVLTLAPDTGDARWTTTIVFSILILILVFRPEGLLGERTPEGA